MATAWSAVTWPPRTWTASPSTRESRPVAACSGSRALCPSRPDLLRDHGAHPPGVLAQPGRHGGAARGVGVEGDRDPALEHAVVVDRQELDEQGAHECPWPVVRGRVGLETGLDAGGDDVQGEDHHLVLGAEVVLHHPRGDPGLGRDVAQAHVHEPAGGGDAEQGVGEQRPALVGVDLLRHGVTLSHCSCIVILHVAPAMWRRSRGADAAARTPGPGGTAGVRPDGRAGDPCRPRRRAPRVARHVLRPGRGRARRPAPRARAARGPRRRAGVVVPGRAGPRPPAPPRRPGVHPAPDRRAGARG